MEWIKLSDNTKKQLVIGETYMCFVPDCKHYKKHWVEYKYTVDGFIDTQALFGNNRVVEATHFMVITEPSQYSAEDFNAFIDRLQIASDIKYPDRLWNAAFKENVKIRWNGQYDLLLDRVLSLEEEIKEITMDIHAKEGTKVIVTENSIENGYDCVKEHAKQHLVVGETYTISRTEVDGWSTAVYLKEFSDEVFNSVSFVNIL